MFPEQESLLRHMTPSQARALRNAYNLHMDTIVKAESDSERRLHIRTMWREDKKQHHYRTIAQIAGMPEHTAVVPLEVMEQIVAEDGAQDEPNRAEHNRATLGAFISQGLELQKRYYLPSELAPQPTFNIKPH
jgi:hypothetical protein